MAKASWLGDQKVRLPTGGVFISTGLIAEWEAADCFRFHTEIEEVTLGSEGFAPHLYAPDRDPPGGWCYYKSIDGGYDTSVAAIEKLDIRTPWQDLQKPDEVWLWHPLSEIITLRDPAAFGKKPRFECPVSTLQSNKMRYALHLTVLPSAVAAMADHLGYDNAGFDITELTSSDTIWTDEFIEEMTGVRHVPEASGRDMYVDIGWQKSTLGKRRDELWASLGEPDSTKFLMVDTKDSGGTKTSSFATESEKLSECLGVIQVAWESSVWASVVLAKRAGYAKEAFSTNGKRLSLPTPVKFFHSEAEARAAAEAEQAEWATSTISGPPVPAMWKGMEEDWAAMVLTIGGAVGELVGPLPVQRARVEQVLSDEAQFPGGVGATMEEVMAWLT